MNRATQTANFEREKIAVDVWKKVVETQEHFNEICMKVRTLYATIVGGIIALIGVINKSGVNEIVVWKISVEPFMLIMISVAVATSLFYFVDRYWYHQLLLGSVEQGREIEERWGNVIPEIGMGSKISKSSVVNMDDRKLMWLIGWLFISDKRFATEKKMHSDAKIELFYKPILFLALALFALGSIAGGLRWDKRSLGSLAISTVCSMVQPTS